MGLKSTNWGKVVKKGVDWENLPWDNKSSANETRQRVKKTRTKNKKRQVHTGISNSRTKRSGA
jgi:hypothetical protein